MKYVISTSGPRFTQGPSKYKAGVPTTQPPHSVLSVVMIKSRYPKCTGCATPVSETRNYTKFWLKNLILKNTFEEPKNTWEDSVKME
jgi:hypothetical protein